MLKNQKKVEPTSLQTNQLSTLPEDFKVELKRLHDRKVSVCLGKREIYLLGPSYSSEATLGTLKRLLEITLTEGIQQYLEKRK